MRLFSLQASMFAARQQAQMGKTKTTASPKAAKKVAAIKPQFKTLSKKSSFVTPFAKKESENIKKCPQMGSPKASPKRSPRPSPKKSPKQSPKFVNKVLDKVRETGKYILKIFQPTH